MKTSEAINIIKQFQTVFRATEKLEDALLEIGQVEAKLNMLTRDAESALKKKESLDGEIVKLESDVEQVKEKRKRDIDKANEAYGKKRQVIQDEFDSVAQGIKAKRENLESQFAKQKAEFDIKSKEMKKELSDVTSAVNSMTNAKETLKAQLGSL